MRKVVALALACVCLIGLVPASPARASSGELGMRFLVRFAATATPAERTAVVASVGGVVDLEISAIGVTRIAVAGDAADAFADGDQVAAFLAGRPAVAFAERDRTLALEFTPNDRYYATDPFTGRGQWGIRKAKVDGAWDIVRGSSSITVAVIDSGVDPDHPELRSTLASGTRAFLSNVGAGCSVQTRDDNGHGTHVAGVIAAAGDNGVGIAGVAFGARVLSLKALDCEGVGLLSDVADAIVYATDRGARIVSISLGSGSDSRTLRSAVEYAADHGVLVVAAAGNCGELGTRCGSVNERSYPGAYEDALAVAATGPDDTRASFSTQGSYVDIAAPGRFIVSTVPTYPNRSGATNYREYSGTSQATPFVAGVAALVWSRDPSLTLAQLRERLVSTADDLGVAGVDPSYGAGRVNALRAVSATPGGYGATYGTTGVPRTAAQGAAFAATVLLTNTSTFAWPASGTGAVSLSYRWVDGAGKTVAPGATVPLRSQVAIGASASLPLLITAPPVSGTFTLRFDLVRSGAGTFSSKGVPAADVRVVVSKDAAATVRATYAASYTAGSVSTAMLAGGRAVVPVTVGNDGSLTWSASGATPVRLATHVVDHSGATIVWEGERTSLAADVAPGASVSLNAVISAPLRPGAYRARVDLVSEGTTWFSSQGVATAEVPFVVVDDYRAVVGGFAAGPLTVSRAAPTATVTLTNTSSARWDPDGAVPIRLSAHWYDGFGHVLVWDGPRTALPRSVAPGETVTVTVALGSVPAGASSLVIDLVAEGLRWFGVASQRQVTLSP